MLDIEDIKRQVKFNCNISDARYWGYYSICGLLMRLRSLYRSEKGLKPWERIPLEEIGPWIEEREALWKELETRQFRPITIAGDVFSPFSFDDINRILGPMGVIYGSGYGPYSKPTFFLAELDHMQEHYDYRVYYLGREYCRDLFCSPAMLQGRCIFLRRETALAFLWERLTEVYTKRPVPLESLGLGPEELKGPLSEATKRKLEGLADNLSHLLLFHEIGEAQEDETPEDWLRLLGTVKDRRKELYLRAVKDIIADTSDLGPLRRAIENQDSLLLSLYILTLEPMRKELFPEVIEIYRKDHTHIPWDRLEEVRQKAYRKFKKIYREALGI